MLRTSGRLVASPSLEACRNRPKHYMDKRTGHYYFYSGKSHHGALKVRRLNTKKVSVFTQLFLPLRLAGWMLEISVAACAWISSLLKLLRWMSVKLTAKNVI